jgi:hypothetical protein
VKNRDRGWGYAARCYSEVVVIYYFAEISGNFGSGPIEMGVWHGRKISPGVDAIPEAQPHKFFVQLADACATVAHSHPGSAKLEFSSVAVGSRSASRLRDFLGNLSNGVSQAITAVAYIVPWLFVVVPGLYLLRFLWRRRAR